MRVRPIALALFLFATAVPALAGPPWMSIEMPANPFDAGTRGAFFTVRTYHHGSPIALQVRAVLEGVVDGKRVSRPVTLERTGTLGLWAVKTAPPAEGTWVVVVIGGEGEYGVTALVDVAGGRVRGVEVPYVMRDGWVIPREVAPSEIETHLRQLAGIEPSTILAKPGHGPGGFPLELLLLGAAVGLVPAGLFAVRRARRR